MYQLVYCSTARRLFSDEELGELLAQSRERNARLAITGLLLYYEGGFMQVLEGAEEHVRDVFSSIARDPRHHQIETILEGPVEQRDFPGWSMAYRHLRRPTELPAGYSDFFHSSFPEADFAAHPGLSRTLLLEFRKMAR